MVNVKSLSLRIVAQFAVILLPLLAVLAYETGAQARRADQMSQALSVHRQALEAKERYGVFVEGAADAVDTGRLSPKALSALGDASAGIDRLIALNRADPTSLAALSRTVHVIRDSLKADSSIAALTRLLGPIGSARMRIEQTAQERQNSLDETIELAVQDAAQTRKFVFVLSALLLIVTMAFVVQMTRGLSRPLRLAVEIADRITAGDKFDASMVVKPQQDIGNLLGSLRRMHTSLRGFEDDVERQRIGLEEKIKQLARSEHSLAQAQRSAKLGSWQWEAGTSAASWSDEMYRILRLQRSEVSPTLRSFLRAFPAEDRRGLLAQFQPLAHRADEIAIEHRLYDDGEERIVHHQVSTQRDGSGRLLQLYGTLQDITDRQRTEEKMRRLVTYDDLTGLANRQFFNEHLRNAVARSKRHGTGLATLFVDLDRFKRINDTLGHGVGDTLLREAATRIRACVRETDTVTPAQADAEAQSMVARLGGDEFIVLLRDILAPRDAAVVASRMVNALAMPFFVEGHELVVTASVGISMYPSDGDNGETLVQCADAAMYAAKKLGRNTYQFFTQEMNTVAFEKLTLESELRRAIEQRQFVLHFQPKIDIRTGAIVGVEALIRWQHPRGGLVPPMQFIPLAEELGLIATIGDWVLEDACRQVAQWQHAGLGKISVAVNLASPSFRKPHLVEDVATLIDRHQLSAGQLQIEATESMWMESGGATLQTLKDLRELGVKLSIDDFGTGYSSLSYLRRFPIDQLKIDRSFVSEMAHNSDDAAIAGAIISLGRNMHREVVAEGVETMAQARMLHRQGCELMQGFLFSRAVSAAEMEELLKHDRPFAWATADLLCEPAGLQI